MLLKYLLLIFKKSDMFMTLNTLTVDLIKTNYNTNIVII